ncbi:hypothetical protein ACFO1B_35610 [Dactylosporangium siamense]|uniref:ABC transporter ATP-binding protein n=1 Tax=Dactylosporangium siamense TaxID=685454 RepID=A0A919PPG3_9ACTN|nr:hypothetical protein Dsi01nite_039440 [Dactylosporangium siamense]
MRSRRCAWSGWPTAPGTAPRSSPAVSSSGAAIARALIAWAEVVFADGPTGALDSAAGRQVLGILRDLVDRERLTVIMATHDPLAATFTDRVLSLADGRVTGEPTAEAVAARMSGSATLTPGDATRNTDATGAPGVADAVESRALPADLPSAAGRRGR